MRDGRLKLSEGVCKKCWLATHGGIKEWWDDHDSNAFIAGSVLCPVDVAKIRLREAITTETPPDWCPRKLEHAIAISMEKNNAQDFAPVS